MSALSVLCDTSISYIILNEAKARSGCMKNARDFRMQPDNQELWIKTKEQVD